MEPLLLVIQHDPTTEPSSSRPTAAATASPRAQSGPCAASASPGARTSRSPASGPTRAPGAAGATLSPRPSDPPRPASPTPNTRPVTGSPQSHPNATLWLVNALVTLATALFLTACASTPVGGAPGASPVSGDAESVDPGEIRPDLDLPPEDDKPGKVQPLPPQRPPAKEMDSRDDE